MINSEARVMDVINVGISACLLGEQVRYDGGHKLDHFLRDTLGHFFTWKPVCPEVECGMPIPREAVRLVGDPAAPRLITSRTNVDKTSQMRSWIARRLPELAAADLCGFVFKSGSPSSGLSRVKVYNDDGVPHGSGAGIFARACIERFPLLPAEDDGRLQDPALRENFIERVFVYKRWRVYCESDGTHAGLVQFHATHKLLVMAHSPQALKTLGSMVAKKYQKREMPQAVAQYGDCLMRSLQLIATVKKNTNVLQHIQGYFKDPLSIDEKQELSEVIMRYHDGLVPLVVPITLIRHYVRKYGEPYVAQQWYLNPHPVELMLRNHC